MPDATTLDLPDILALDGATSVPRERYGARAVRVARLASLALPVPQAVALSIPLVRGLAGGQPVDKAAILGSLGHAPIVSVRASPGQPDWGGPGTVLNVGFNDEAHAKLSGEMGEEAATRIYLRFLQAYSITVARLDADIFDRLDQSRPDRGLAEARAIYEAEMDEPFPQSVEIQLGQVLRSMARAWEGTSARLLRQARGAPADAGLGLIVQRMVFGYGRGECGAGMAQFVTPDTGEPGLVGRYLSQSQGRDAVSGRRVSGYLRRDPRGPALEELAPDAFAQLRAHGMAVRRAYGEDVSFEFTVQDGTLWVLDVAPARRSARAAVRIAVDLAVDGAISRDEALLKVEPRMLTALMHAQVHPEAEREVIARGIPASPGAARGAVVFSSAAAQSAAARGEDCILVRTETTPEDIRGMQASAGVLTERGGVTSHAAVIARGLGVPCVVGAEGIDVDDRARKLRLPGGQVLKEGDVLTLDGTAGEVLGGAPEMLEAAIDGAFSTLLSWADEVRVLRVRANADTDADARVALDFGAEGIGLCRTEHMFFEDDRLTMMREMIFADRPDDRRAVLERLLPLQRSDFISLFKRMRGKPVCIRLFDLPLHEFLPKGREAIRDLADALDLPVSQVMARAADLAEVNPMLGMRGVRLGIALPEIYEMQARAIFEAADAAAQDGDPVVPEVMIPLVSALREVDMVRGRVEGVAAAVHAEIGRKPEFKLGVMVETPRAALRAGEIALLSDFLSFGTNDLTQMTYGLSRDDAGRFMSAYVAAGVFAEDPFHILDADGVGELLQLAGERGRAARPDLVLSVCGEHGGNPESIAFCHDAGFSHVSCSPFRVPVARLAAAQAALRRRVPGIADSVNKSP